MTDPVKTDPLKDLGQWLDLFGGKTTTNTTDGETTTSSTRSNMSAGDVQQQIDMAMAPVNVEQHTMGMYGSTPLAIARGQIASDIASKNAGSTTTHTTSGKTSTQKTPGPLDSSNAGNTAKSLLLSQFGAPLLKGIAKKPTDWLASMGEKAGDSINQFLTPGPNPIDSANLAFDFSSPTQEAAASGGGATAAQYASDIAGTVVSGGSDVIDAAVSGGSDLLDKIGTGVSDGFDAVKSFFGFADGGQVRGLDAPSRGNSNLILQSLAKPTISANGEIAPPAPAVSKVPTVGDSSATAVRDAIRGSSQSTDPLKGINTMTYGAPETTSLTSGATGTLVAPDAMKGVTALNVIAGMIPGVSTVQSILHGMFPDSVSKSAQSLIMGNIWNAMGAPPDYKMAPAPTPDPVQVQADADTQVLQQTLQVNPYGDFGIAGPTAPTGGNGGITNPGYGDRGPGGSSGEAGASAGGAGPAGPGGYSTNGAVDGGYIQGPGTGTSDSIPARLSNGETVVTAKTTAKVKELFGDDFFHNLEQQFNAAAAQVQVAKGRA